MVNSSSEEPVCASPTMMVILRVWLAGYLLLLPLFAYVLYLGHKQWRNQQSLSHSDVFTFTIIGMELMMITGTSIYAIGVHTSSIAAIDAGDSMFSMGMVGQLLIHSLTCAERYLAVVHPITYLCLKKRGGVRIRNVSIACTWIFTVGSICLRKISILGFNFEKFVILALACFSVALVSFCSGSVLCVLIRPGPGKGGGDLKRVAQSKRRAFYTMVGIMGVLMLRFVVLVGAYVASTFLRIDDACLVTMSSAWFYLPSSLVLPVMFLQKAGKLPKCPVIGQRLG